MLTKEFESELKKWRHDFHASPELNFDVNQTAAKVAELLKSFGLEVHTGIGGTGVVGVLKKLFLLANYSCTKVSISVKFSRFHFIDEQIKYSKTFITDHFSHENRRNIRFGTFLK